MMCLLIFSDDKWLPSKAVDDTVCSISLRWLVHTSNYMCLWRNKIDQSLLTSTNLIKISLHQYCFISINTIMLWHYKVVFNREPFSQGMICLRSKHPWDLIISAETDFNCSSSLLFYNPIWLCVFYSRKWNIFIFNANLCGIFFCNWLNWSLAYPLMSPRLVVSRLSSLLCVIVYVAEYAVIISRP